MERERWDLIYRLLCPHDQWDHRGLYSAAVIAAVYFWAVINDRPVCWACLAKHWDDDIPLRRHLPSQATMSRRLRQAEVQSLLTTLEQQLQPAPSKRMTVKIVDGKPLPVGGYSRDPDARWGYAVRGLLKGYKLFAIWDKGPLPSCWRVGSMNLSEPSVAIQMMSEMTGHGLLLGDKVYDVNRLYDAAHAAHYQLLAERKHPHAGLGHCHHSAYRLRGMKILKTKQGRKLYRKRTCIEQQFGGLTNFGGGLGPLPSWVRRITRVQLWVQAKLIINALRLNNLARLTATA